MQHESHQTITKQTCESYTKQYTLSVYCRRLSHFSPYTMVVAPDKGNTAGDSFHKACA